MPTFKSADSRVISIEAKHLPNRGAIRFPSIITQFTDSWGSQWKEEAVYSRMDPLSFYGGTTRKLQVGFRIISESLGEAAINMRLLQEFIQWQYPLNHFTGANAFTLKAPPYFKIKFLNTISLGSESLEGYFNGPITINPGFQQKDKAQFFSQDGNKLYFSDVEIVLQMIVMHQKRTGYYAGRFGSSPLPDYPYNIPGRSSVANKDAPDPFAQNLVDDPKAGTYKAQTARTPINLGRFVRGAEEETVADRPRGGMSEMTGFIITQQEAENTVKKAIPLENKEANRLDPPDPTMSEWLAERNINYPASKILEDAMARFPKLGEPPPGFPKITIKPDSEAPEPIGTPDPESTFETPP